MGPTIQLSNNDMESIFLLENTLPSSSYLTLANGGYIITMRPMAKGILVVPDSNRCQKSVIPGLIYPMNTPMNIARNIHSVRYLSRNLSFVFILET